MKCNVFIIAAIAFLVFSCSKPDGPNGSSITDSLVPPGYKAYLYQTWLANASGTTTLYYQCDYNSNNNVTYIGGPGFSTKYTYSGTSLITQVHCVPDITSTGYVTYDIVYDSGNQPLWGIRTFFKGGPTYSGPSQAPSSTTIFLDSIRFKTTGGNVTEVRFFDRRSRVSHFPNYPSTNGFYWDTTLTTAGMVETYQLSYTNDNINKIHSEDRAGKIVDREYAYGTKKGVMSDTRLPQIIAPDLILQYPYVGLDMLFSFGKNDLLTAKNTFVSENNRTETTSFAYTYNKYEYPVAVIMNGPTASTTSLTGTRTIKFIYK